jgi:hypothetical protein
MRGEELMAVDRGRGGLKREQGSSTVKKKEGEREFVFGGYEFS